MRDLDVARWRLHSQHLVSPFALMTERVPAPRRLGRTEALAELALRSFVWRWSTRSSSPPCGASGPARLR